MHKARAATSIASRTKTCSDSWLILNDVCIGIQGLGFPSFGLLSVLGLAVKYHKLKGSPQMVRGRGAWLRGRGARAICGAEALLYGFDGLPCGSDSDVVWQIHVGTYGNIQSYPKHCVV